MREELKTALRHLPPGAKLTVSIEAQDLAEALEAAEANPDKYVTSVWLAEELGMSRKWWATHADEIPGTFQETEGAPHYFRLGEARAFLERHVGEKARTRGKRRRSRGPRKD